MMWMESIQDFGFARGFQMSRYVAWGPGVQVGFHVSSYPGIHTAETRSQLSPKQNGVEDTIKILGQ